MGVRTRHQPRSARSCELALPAARAARGHPGGGRLLPWCGASVVGRSLTADRPSLGRVAGAPYRLAVNVGACAAVRLDLCALPELAAPGAIVAWHLSLCHGCCRLRASLACLVAPRWCTAPRLVRSLSMLRLAFPLPWCLPPSRGLSPRALLGGCAGHVEARREPGSLCLPLAPAEAGALGSLRVVSVQGSVMGSSLEVPSSLSVGLRALWLLVLCGPGH